MKRAYITIAFLYISLSSFATPQVTDILIWKGDTLQLFSNPIELRDDYSSLIIKIWDEIDKQDLLLYPDKIDEDRILYFFSVLERVHC